MAYGIIRVFSGSSARPTRRLNRCGRPVRGRGEIVIGAHYQNYERFAPQTPDGTAERPSIREFVDRHGGAGHTDSHAAPQQRGAQQLYLSGRPKLTLSTDGTGAYTWEFVPVAGASFTDTGSGSCHDAPPAAPAAPTAAATSPTTATAARRRSPRRRRGHRELQLFRRRGHARCWTASTDGLHGRRRRIPNGSL